MSRSMSVKSRKGSRQAQRLFRSFRGDSPDHVTMIDLPDIEAAMVIGELTAVEYDTVRDGELELYRHQFEPQARPLLCCSPDGRWLFCFGGSYRVKSTGINDI